MLFFDAHCDTVARTVNARMDFLWPPPRANMDLPRLLEAGACVQVFDIFARASHRPGWDLSSYVDQAIETIKTWVVHSEGRMRLALHAADIREAAGGRGFYGLIGMEGADSLGTQAEGLTRLVEQGVRLLIPAWDDNAFSGTAYGKGGPLTDEGIKLVELAESLRCMVDVSHLSDASFQQVCQIAQRPFIASHSACRALCPNMRNLTDPMIRALADRGGVVGVPMGPFFLDIDYMHAWWDVASRTASEVASITADLVARKAREDVLEHERAELLPRPGMARVVEHILHVIQVGGEDSVGLGGDLDGLETLMQDMTGVECYPALPEMLMAAGLTSVQVEKICWRNMARVFADVLPEMG